MHKQILAASLITLSVVSMGAQAAETDKVGSAVTNIQVAEAGPVALKQIQKFLSIDVDLGSLSGAQLLQRYKLASEYSATPGLQSNLKSQLQNEAKATRNELARRKAAGGDKAKAEPQATTKRRVTGAEQPAEVAATDKEMSPQKVRRPAAQAKPDNQPRVVEDKTRRSTGVNDSAGTQVAEQAPAKPRRPAVESDAAKATSAEERAALKLLQDQRPAQRVDARDLARRLATARALLQSGKLSDQTRRRIGDMIRADRVVVRDRQQARNDADEKRRVQEDRAKNKDSKPKFSVDVNIDLRPETVVLRDRRRAEELSPDELRHRIRIYRDVENERDYQRYDVAERRYWREQLYLDRDYMRRQLVEERRRRESDLRERNREIVINVRPVPSDEIDIFAAESDESQIEEVLVAAPRERVQRRYQVEEVANDANLRRSIPRVEVDTIRFGNNEAIVREEEVPKLDRIGAVLERILRGHPREVFLIEGHTDAVGSDIYNLGLSRARADAVKQALTTYYNIPPQNLKTVGLGERFLKVPTYESEPENRRVSIGRITAYVGEN